MEGGSIAAPLVKFKAASAENLYHCNDKGEDRKAGTDPSLFSFHFSEQKKSKIIEGGGRCVTCN